MKVSMIPGMKHNLEDGDMVLIDRIEGMEIKPEF